jgi:UDP-4-amino-4,6-dideoxy-N-acetyl-beta-L-altrosamine N-acetyltransferase
METEKPFSVPTQIDGRMVYLRPVERTDIERLRAWRNSKEVSTFMLTRDLITEEQQEAWFEKIKDDPSGMFWMIISKQDEKLGMASLVKIDHAAHTAEPGLYIGQTKHRNSFFGMEAYYWLLRFGFEVLGLEKVYGTILSVNKVAIKMNRAFGFVTIDTSKQEIEGQIEDVFRVQLDRQAFYTSRMTHFFERMEQS